MWQVYNTMAIHESSSIGKLTWINLIYPPLRYVFMVKRRSSTITARVGAGARTYEILQPPSLA